MCSGCAKHEMLCALLKVFLDNLVNKANLVHNLFINLYMFQATDTAVFIWHMLLVILYRWLCGIHPAFHTAIHTQ